MPESCPESADNLVLPQYYNNGTMFQTGPSAHTVWGFAKHPNCTVVVKEECKNGYGMYMQYCLTFSSKDILGNATKFGWLEKKHFILVW